MKKLLLLSLALITLFTSCTGSVASLPSNDQELINNIDIQEPSNSDFEAITPMTLPSNTLYATNEDKLFFTDSNGKAAFSIVYPEKTIEIIHDAAENLRVALNKATGKSFKKHSDATANSDNAYEILIGNTNRAQSKHNLKEKEYSIKVDGNKIVIVGGSYYATAVAVKEFKELFSKNAPYIKKNLSYTSEANDLYRVAVSNSGTGSIDIYEVTPFNTTPKLVKRFLDAGATGINFRWTEKHGEVIVCATGTVVKVLNYNTGKVIWSKTGVASGAHGAELLPNGVVAVASSSSDTISFYNMNGSSSKTVTLDDAHAVLWDPKYQVVWALGYYEIRAYTVTLSSSGAITVKEDTDKRFSFKGTNTGGHDLAPVYYDKDKMWVSCFSKIYIYDKVNKKFSTVIEGDNGIVGYRRVKGLGNFPDGSMVTTYPDEAEDSLYTWTTEKINFYFKYEGKLYYTPLYTPNMHYYKARIVCTDYQ